MPNVDLDDSTHAGDLNGCVPASCANSMLWLESQHPEIDLPPNLREAFEQLSNLMNRMAGQGATTEEMIKAKLDFIEAYGLPIKVKYQSVHLEGNISSTSGKSSAEDRDGAANEWPTQGYLESEAEDDEDVELFGGYYYWDGAAWRRPGGHAVVVSGVGSIGGNPFVTWKDDDDQEKPGGQDQETSAIDVVNGQMHIPGLDGWIEIAPGVWQWCTFWVEGVISESYDATVTPPGNTETMGAYCTWIIRTIPPGAKITVTYPHGDRCFNSTVWVLDRTVKPPVWRKVKVWNFNSDSTRVYVNETGFCVTVAIHNDDNSNSGGPYPAFDVTLANVAAGGSTTTASNPDAYGGFSLGGTDGSSGEFGNPVGPSVLVDASEGLDLSTVPGHLGGTGVQTLGLTHPIPVWNTYWSHLELKIVVLGVTSPGLLHVTTSYGFVADLPIAGPGAYALDLGTVSPIGSIQVDLSATAGLEIEMDALGLASLVAPPTGSTGRVTPLVAGLWNLGPNPATGALKLRFDLPREAQADLAVFDVTGARVATLLSGVSPAGSRTLTWNASDGRGRRVAPGLYFARLEVDGRTWMTRVVIIR
jgi:hypothetical protein